MNRVSYIFILLVTLFACREEPEVSPDIKWTKDQSTTLGKNLAEQEELDIKLFLEMHKDWEITRSGSGLRYYIYENGDGDSIRTGDVAEIQFVVSLLDGTECYKRVGDEYEEMVVDRSEIESGVQEGIKKMRVGDRAKLIIPSHIAHGLLGDRNKIPPLTPLLVDLSIIGKK